jgi:hypothetical protein
MLHSSYTFLRTRTLEIKRSPANRRFFYFTFTSNKSGKVTTKTYDLKKAQSEYRRLLGSQMPEFV